MAAGSGFVLVLLSWLGSAILFVFGILCLAAGLFYMAEFVEENTVLTKKSLQKILIGVVVVQVLVGVLSTVSIWPVTLVGLVAHGLYAQLLVTFPYFDLSSPKFIGSAVLLVIHHFVVFSHFSYRYYPFDQPAEARQKGGELAASTAAVDVVNETPVSSTAKPQQQPTSEEGQRGDDGEDAKGVTQHQAHPAPTTSTTVSAEDEHAIRKEGVSPAGLRQFLADLKAAHPDTYQKMTTKEACDSVVIPRTKAKQCAYVDVMDSQHVGRKATVFVSHAWRYKIVDVIGTLLEFAGEQGEDDGEDKAQVFFWFDLFINNQNTDITANLPQEWWSTTFKESIAAIGHVLLVLTPWHDPVPLTRAWCLWEIFCSASQEDVQLTIRLPNAERDALKEAVLETFEAVTDAMVRVQAERADAWDPKDKEMIFKAIEDGVGFLHLNKVVKDQMRNWCFSEMLSFVEPADDEQVDTPQFARLCYNVGVSLKTAGRYDHALSLFERSLNIYLERHGPEHANVAGVYDAMAQVYESKGEHDRAQEYFQKSLQIALDTLGEEHPSTAGTYGKLGGVYESNGEYDRAIEYYQKSLKIQLDTLGEKHLDIATTYNGLGQVYSSKGEYDRAIHYYHKCLQTYLETLGKKHPYTATAYNNLGLVYKSKGEHDHAVEYFQQSLQIKLDTLGEEHPSTAGTYNNLGQMHYSKGEYDRAIHHYHKCLQIYLGTLGEKHPSTATTFNVLGQVHNSKGEYDRALEYYQKCLQIDLDTLGEEHPSTANTYNSLGQVYKNQGEYGRALECYQKDLKITLDTLGEKHPDTATTYHDLGQVYNSKGEYDRAKQLFQQAVDIWMDTLGPDHPRTKMGVRWLDSLHE
ncbi:mbre TPR repeat protein [Salpingoeca rosetta]|uniref:Mbre TPR repeat protein n=1 Tax=Salpingoeca rosetta (strain ATCC 50818 / BSB-021) TaxID=946362 RepID=F2UN07_SALR5|nr:mbre TPR repeat protein [Salpingoeca rosetta]EGD78506.1 mbre TPR repeat protein [Salpingoeca rosetta]|eukprot:XP_004989455.1 mbre TPR repeat protein [Salpingoeca rosetta]